MEFSRPEYWSGSPFPSPDLPNPGIEPRCPTLQADSILSEPPGNPFLTSNRLKRTILVLNVLWPAVYLTNKRYCFNPQNSQEFKYAFFFLLISWRSPVSVPFYFLSPTQVLFLPHPLNNCGGGQLPSLPKGLGTGDPQMWFQLWLPACDPRVSRSCDFICLLFRTRERSTQSEVRHPDVICRILPCTQSSPIPTCVWSLQPTQELISLGVPILWL